MAAIEAQPSVSDECNPHALVLNRYKVEKLLGEGSYGKVKLAIDTRTGDKVAMKVIHKSCIKKPVHITRLKREVRIMKLLHHPHIVKLFEVAETDKEIILVMEFMEGGELFDYIVTQKKVKEKIARKFFRQVLSAVDYCHQSRIIHRDLKPENLLLDSNLNIKIIDFGFVNLFDPEDYLNTFCGSPFYASPEMVLGKQYVGPEVDVWSLGVILFALLSGHLPFRDNVSSELYRKIANAIYTMPDSFSPVVQDLVRRMLTVDPKQRITIEQIRNHPWVTEGYSGPPDSLIPPRPRLTQLDDYILNKMSSYGFEKENAIPQLLGNVQGPALAVYYLIKEQMDREKERSSKHRHREMATISESNLDVTNTDMSADSATSAYTSCNNVGSVENSNQNLSTGDAGAHLSTVSAVSAGNIAPPPTATTLAQRLSLRSAYRTATTLHPEHAHPVSVSHNELSSQASPRRLGRRTTVGDTHSTTLLQPKPIAELNESIAQRPPSGSQVPALPQIVVGDAHQSEAVQDQNSATGSENVEPKKDPRVRRKTLNEAVLHAFASVSNSVSRLRKDRNSEDEDGGVAKPRTIKVMFGVDTTSTKAVPDIIAEVERVLSLSNIIYTQKGFKFSCTAADKVELELEICKIHKTNMHGLVFKRLKGSIWNYQNVCQGLIAQWRL